MDRKTTNALHATVSAIIATAFSKPPRGSKATVTSFTIFVALIAVKGSTLTTPSNYIRNRQAILTVASVNGTWHTKVRWIVIGGQYIRSNARDVGKSLRVKTQRRHIEGLSGIESVRAGT